MSAVALLSLACGGSTPTQPQPNPAPNTPPQTWAMSGTVTTTLTGEPVAGASLDFFNIGKVTTNGSGEWRLERATPITTRTYVEVTAPDYVPRRVYVDGSSTSRSGIAIDMIRDGGAFSLGFYRQFVRNDYDAPGQLQWLRRWTQNPSVYVDIRNPRTGELTPDEIEGIRRAAAEAIAAYTGGRFHLERFEYGAAARPETSGWINVNIVYEPAGDFCGRSRLGANPGLITMNYDRCASECGSMKLGGRTLRHEFGHAMGFWHVGDQSALLHSNPATREPCGATTFAASELHHARIAYARPVGNADQDWDQPSSALFRAFADQAAPVVSCFGGRGPERGTAR